MASNFYDIVRQVKGGLTLTLPTFDSTGTPRVFSIAYNMEKIRVPRNYALGIFADPILEQMYKDGVFTVEPASEFEKDVAEVYMPIENKVDIIPDKTFIDYLKKNNRMKVKEIADQGGVNRDKLIVLARENIGDIPTSMIKYLEELLKVELQVENE